jgi:protein SCO1/2
MITVDPERDTTEHFANYLAYFNETFIGLRPESPEQLQAALEIFGASAAREDEQVAAETYLLNHSASIYVVDLDQNLRLIWVYSTPTEDMVADLKHLLKELQL